MRFAAYAFAVILITTALEWRGVNLLPTSEHARIPSTVRSSPGGYRSYHSYRSFHGGK